MNASTVHSKSSVLIIKFSHISKKSDAINGTKYS